MKKIFAMICALTICCMAFAGCGEKPSENTSSADGSVVSESGTEAESESSSPEITDESSAADTTLARAYTDMLGDKDFKVTMVTSSDLMFDTTTMVEVFGDDYHMSVGDGADSVDLYLINGVMYMLNYSDMTYIKDETPDEMYLSIDMRSYAMGVEDSYKFIVSETTADGIICETYHAPDLITGEMPTNDEDENATVYKYYFEQNGTTPVKIEMSAYGLSQTTTFSDFSYDVAAIELPDLSEWTDTSEGPYSGDTPAEFE